MTPSTNTSFIELANGAGAARSAGPALPLRPAGPPGPAEPQPGVHGSAPADLCRLTVFGPGGRVDLAVPSTATIGLLLPAVARRLGRDIDEDRTWVLQRLGEPPLDVDATPELADLRDGDVLHLRPAAEAMPELRYDDLADGVAESIAARDDRWGPGSTRRVLVGLASFTVAVLALALLQGDGPGGLFAVYFGVLSLALAGGTVVVDRITGDGPLSLAGGIGACAYAAVAGVVGRQTTADLFAAQPPGVLLGGACLVVVAVALGAACRTGIAVYGTAALVGLCGIAGALLVLAQWTAVAGALAILAVLMFLISTFGPRLAARFARLRVPDLPRTADELQEDIDPVPADLVANRSALADGLLTAVIGASSVASLAAGVVVAERGGWISLVFPLLLSIATLLRGRSVQSRWQRGATIWAGSSILGGLVLSGAAELEPAGRAGLLVGGLVVLATLILGARRLPKHRLLPIWGRLAEIAELWSAIALVPLLLVLLGTYGFFRALGG